ncbi:MAG TPA: hypothetical protein VGX28_01085 [Frankiaceae bacterium]|nr:hypothetical protein [Frankiaceae bacterium]
MRVLRLLTAALLATASGAAVTPAHAASPPLAARGVLGAETTLTWSGAAAIRLSVAGPTGYRGGDVDLWVSGATFAFVRIMAPHQPEDCPQTYGPRCLADRVNWVHGLHDSGAFDSLPVSHRHDAFLAEPALLEAPHVDVYLFTDGKATLRIRTTTLRGHTAYRPGARFRGYAGEIPQTCVPFGCGDATGRSNGYTYGGQTFDLQGAGWAEFYAINRADDRGTLPNNGNQPRSIAGCMFPNWRKPAASAEAKDHPYGCGDTSAPGDAEDAAVTAAMEHASGTSIGSNASNVPWSGAKGRQYIGFEAASAGPGPSRALAYGIWFRFL